MLLRVCHLIDSFDFIWCMCLHETFYIFGFCSLVLRVTNSTWWSQWRCDDCSNNGGGGGDGGCTAGILTSGLSCLIGSLTKLTQKLVVFPKRCAPCCKATWKRKQSDEEEGGCWWNRWWQCVAYDNVLQCPTDEATLGKKDQQQSMQKLKKEEEEAKNSPSCQCRCSVNFVGPSGAMPLVRLCYWTK